MCTKRDHVTTAHVTHGHSGSVPRGGASHHGPTHGSSIFEEVEDPRHVCELS